MKSTLFFLVFVSVSATLKGQYHDNPMFGLRLGASYNYITNLPNTLIDEENRPMHTMEERKSFSPVFALFTHYRFENTQVPLEGRVSFFRAATKVLRYATHNTDTEMFDFRLQYVSFDLASKVYLHEGLMVGAGIGFGQNINSSSGIRYHSSFYTPSQILQTTGHINQALNSRANITASVLAGYEFRQGLSIEIAYIYGLADIIDTVVNPYNFSESRNNIRNIQLTVGWAIGSDGFHN